MRLTVSYGIVFLFENWYNSKKSEVDALRRKSIRLKQNVDLAIVVDIKEEQLLVEGERMLNRIKPQAGYLFDPDPKNCCMPDTRVDLIERLLSFAASEDTSQRLFLISGIAGCGKSSVATSVANLLYQRDCLLGSFFPLRVSEKMSIPINFLHTIAYSVALRHAPYRKALIEALKKDAMIEDQGLSIQFDALLRKPLSEVLKISSTNTSYPSHRAIVIDALDECYDPQSISSYLAEIVALVPWLKIIVTSRPLDDIEANLRSAGYMIHLDLFTVDASEDILRFTQSRFAPGGPLHPLRSQVTEQEIQALAKRSHRLFIWIKTVLSYLDNFPFTHAKLEEMKSILSSRTAASPEKELDQLYLRVLRSVARTSEHYQDAVKNLVGFIYATSRNRSLPCKGLHAFIPIRPDVPASPDDVHHLRSKLAAVITIDPETEAVQVCHPSFLDFVASEARSQEFWTEPEVLDTTMAVRCFSILKDGQESGISRRASNRDAMSVLRQQIPQELQYSAVYWLDHLSRSQASCPNENTTVAEIEACEFLYRGGLLYLLVVLSLVSEFNVATQVVSKIIDLISKTVGCFVGIEHRLLTVGRVSCFQSALLVLPTLIYV